METSSILNLLRVELYFLWREAKKVKTGYLRCFAWLMESETRYVSIREQEACDNSNPSGSYKTIAYILRSLCILVVLMETYFEV